MYAEYKNVPIHGVQGSTQSTRNVHGVRVYKLILGVQAFYDYDMESP